MADETRAQLAHLFRRAAFGARPDELDYYALRGYAAAVDDLVGRRPVAGSARLGVPTDALSGPAAGDEYKRSELRKAQGRWLREMVTTSTPLVERMTLFLTEHFATSFSAADRISVIDIEKHLSTVRAHALGNFADLCHALIEDAAFAMFLDNHRNRRGAPNENLAREFLELFTIGAGNFTETDVREAARTLTGYKLAKADMLMSGMDDSRAHTIVFESRLHDYGEKQVLGHHGTFMPHDIVDIALSHPAAPQFLATQLVSAFQSPSPNPALVTKVAAALSTNRWQLAPALRALFMAPEFRAASSRSTMVKAPAEFVAGALRALKRTEYEAGAGLVAASGQSLFEPPTVAGWTPNEGWLGTGAMLGRYNAGASIGQTHASAPAVGFVAPSTVAGWAAAFGMVELSAATTKAVNQYLTESLRYSDKVRQAGVVTLMISSPEFSLA